MIYATLDFETALWDQGYKIVCGIDEVGRGCFAGPVAAGAVVFPSNCQLIEGLADSKLLSAKKREELTEKIKEQALFWAVGLVDVDTINRIGIGKATQLAYRFAIYQLLSQPDYILVDAFYINGLPKDKQQPIQSGDKLSASIAAASIIAKVYRDKLMAQMDPYFPGYGFAVHKGYGTKKHQAAIKELGLSDFHRTSFNLSKFL